MTLFVAGLSYKTAPVEVRERELALCHQIIDMRVAALMDKLNLEKERLYDVGLQSQPGWVSHGTAVLGS
ncbi:MAG: hypothetical protein ABSA97_02780 [Verrucomicrobiia bacterium]